MKTYFAYCVGKTGTETAFNGDTESLGQLAFFPRRDALLGSRSLQCRPAAIRFCNMPPISHRADEETPLLQAAKPDSFPWLRTLALCLSRSLETFVFFSIIPWIPALIERTGISKQDLGFYVGLVEACFSATQFVFILFWGQVADRYGRKPTLLIALAGVSFCTAAFGTSTSVAQMILYRSIAGVFSACTA